MPFTFATSQGERVAEEFMQPPPASSPPAAEEPVFALRAQDVLAPVLVRTWADLAALHGCPPEKIREAREIALAMERWQQRYPTRTKLPD